MIRFRTSRSSAPKTQKTTKPIPAELFAEIRRISFLARKRAHDGLFGRYKSAFKGQGIEFEELRTYVPGDDVRSIHWGATARSQTPQIKRYREERELQVLLAIDTSGSGNSGSGTQSRKQLLAQLGATLACIALSNNDKIGLLTFSNRVESFTPPRKTRGSVWRIIHEILYPEHDTGEKTDLAAMFEFLSSVLKRRTVIFILSDFIDSDFQQSLNVLARKHDVSAFIIRDPSEVSLPRIGLLRIRNPETRALQTLDTADAKQREWYFQQNKAFRSAQVKQFYIAKVPSLELWTGRSFTRELRTFFDAKGKRHN